MTRSSTATALWPAQTRPAPMCEVMRAPGELVGRRQTWRYRQPAVAIVTDGYFGYRTDRGEQAGVAGGVVAGNADEAFEVSHLCHSGHRRSVVFLDQAMLDEVAQEEDHDAPLFAASIIAPSKSATVIAAALALLAGSPDGAAENSYRLTRLLLRQGRAARPPAPPQWREAARLQRSIGYIQHHFDEVCALETLAGIAGMSRYHFLRRFSAFVGCTPNQFVIHNRLIAASYKLAMTKEPIAQIALGCGFNDVSHFYRLFGERFGMPPARWRKQR